jgi:chromate transporter
MTRQTTRTALLDVGLAFLRLGCTSFGGPVAHLGYLRAEFVERRRWMDETEYADLVALCQFLPGPASSQVVFAIGMTRAGVLGALLASLCFTLPSALLMIAFAYGVAQIPNLETAGWLHGLKVAAVAVVAQAVWGMAKKLCTDGTRIALALFAAAALQLAPAAMTQVGVIALGALLGVLRYGQAPGRTAVPQGSPPAHDARTPSAPQTGRALPYAGAALVSFGVVLLALPALARFSGSPRVALFDSFYRSGALVFGGGHVVLPLLRGEIVPRGWLADDSFLAGYAAAQAVPGPMFSFAAYLGAAMTPGPPRWQTGLACLLAIFTPAWLLIGGALPFWKQLRTRTWAQGALAGANAAVVGVLLAALIHPVFTEGVHGRRDLAAAAVAWLFLERVKVPAWCVVAASAAAGQWVLGP